MSAPLARKQIRESRFESCTCSMARGKCGWRHYQGEKGSSAGLADRANIKHVHSRTGPGYVRDAEDPELDQGSR